MSNNYLAIVLVIDITSSSVGALNDPTANTRLIGSKSLESDLDRYAFSKALRQSRNAFSGLEENRETF